MVDKPVHRATTFVPRLGKRQLDEIQFSWPDLERLCANYELGCVHLLAGRQGQTPVLTRLIRALDQSDRDEASGELLGRDFYPFELPSSFMSRDTRASSAGGEEGAIREQRDSSAGEELLERPATGRAGGKRVTFTPRIGRR